MADQRDVMKVTILNGASLSGEINVGPRRIVGIQMPAAWTAAGITFVALTRRDDSASPPTDTFAKVQDAAGAEVTVTSPAADTYVALDEDKPLRGLGRIKIRSGTSATPVAQGADRVIGIVVV